MNPEDKRTARRRWLVAAARYATLSGVGLLAWNLVSRPGHCFQLSLPCQDCGLVAHCRLPDAASSRQTRAEEVSHE